VQSYHKNGKFRGASPDLLSGVQAIHFGHLEVQDDHVWGDLLNFIDSFSTIGGFAAHLPCLPLFQQIAQTTPHKGAIVGDENSNGR
jgi:hypothetical protein